MSAVAKQRLLRCLDGNPAMHEIWDDALERIAHGIELAPVQSLVVQETLIRSLARRTELQLLSRRGLLHDSHYRELREIEEQLAQIEGAFSRGGEIMTTQEEETPEEAPEEAPEEQDSPETREGEEEAPEGAQGDGETQGDPLKGDPQPQGSPPA